MKCLCGYEYKEEFDEENYNIKVIIGDTEFNKIEGTFIIKEKNWDSSRIKEIELYSCPKCGTIKTDY
jgi:hypothetical protein